VFTAFNKVRIHDIDMAGILYFARIYRFAHEALEDFFSHAGFDFKDLFGKSDFSFVIVHSEADYKVSLTLGDELEVQMHTEHVGNSSFTLVYQIYRVQDHLLTGTVKTVHVTIDPKTRKKIPVPEHFRAFLNKQTT
jgi:1,4-dihydroxy-2-naphthoyl-CoA hydrolase